MNVRRCLIVILLVTGSACKGPAEDGGNVHATSSDSLRQIMQRMQTLSFEREMTAEAVRALRARRLRELQQTTEVLLDDVVDLSATLSLTEAEADEFKKLATRLAKEASRVGDRAQALDPADLDAALQRIEATCDACHAQFRDGR